MAEEETKVNKDLTKAVSSLAGVAEQLKTEVAAAAENKEGKEGDKTKSDSVDALKTVMQNQEQSMVTAIGTISTQPESVGQIVADTPLPTLEPEFVGQIVDALDNSIAATSEGNENIVKAVESLAGVNEEVAEGAEESKQDGPVGEEESKADKLKEKEAERKAKKAEAKKQNVAAFKDAVKGVKDFGKSAFDKIKGMLIKGALILALTQVGKFLNSDAWVKMKAFIIDTLIPLLGNIWDNVLKPLFDGIIDVFSIIVDLLSGDMDSALQTFKDNWVIITPLIAGILIALAVYMFGVISTMYSVLAGAITAMIPVLVAAAPFLLIAAGIALLFYGIYKLLEMLKEKMNLSSIMDLVFIAWGYVQDGFGHLVNVYISIANLIMGLVGKFADFLGFDIEMPVLEKMKTNNAQIATEKAQTNKRIADAEKAASVAKEEKQQTSAAINGGGGGGAVMANNNNTTNVDQSSTTQLMSTPMPDMTQFANYGEVQLA